MDIVERLAQQAAEAINGGEFNDGKWFTEGQRQAWRKAMTPAADEIERLQKALQLIADPLRGPDLTHYLVVASYQGIARKALKGK